MSDAMGAPTGGHGGTSGRALVWIGLAAMALGQLADAVLVSRRSRCRPAKRTAPTTAAT